MKKNLKMKRMMYTNKPEAKSLYTFLRELCERSRIMKVKIQTEGYSKQKKKELWSNFDHWPSTAVF